MKQGYPASALYFLDLVTKNNRSFIRGKGTSCEISVVAQVSLFCFKCFDADKKFVSAPVQAKKR